MERAEIRRYHAIRRDKGDAAVEALERLYKVDVRSVQSLAVQHP